MIFIKRILYRLKKSLLCNKSRTVRSAFPLVLSMLMLTGATLLSSEESSYIRIESSDNHVTEGDQFTIQVYAGAHVPINAVDVSVHFPNEEVSIEGIDTGESVITIWTTEPHIDDDAIVLQGGTFRKGFLGEHLIARINATAKKDGIAKFFISDKKLLAGDGKGTAISTKKSNSESLIVYVDVAEDADATLEGNVSIILYTDVDGNGIVDMADISEFMIAWFDKTRKFDFNDDGKMTFVDFAIILSDSFFK